MKAHMLREVACISGLGQRPVATENLASCRPFANGLRKRATPQQQHQQHVVTAQRERAIHLITRAAISGAHDMSVAGMDVSQKPLRIVFVAAEVGPWSKTGGLGDVVGGLPIELAKRGHKVMTIAPRYDQYADAWDTSVTKNIDGQQCRYFHTRKNGVDRVWVDNPAFLSKVWGKTGGKLYGSKSGSDFADNQKRFVTFNKAAIEALRLLPFSPGEDCVVVSNDWHTAMFPVLLKELYQSRGEFRKTKVALCVHNIAYQGRFWESTFEHLGLPQRLLDKFAFQDGNPRVYDETEPDDAMITGEKGRTYRKINWMKAGILSADKVLTVSPNYAQEIQQNEQKGVELDNVIRQAGGVEGIVNGMDTTDWSPNVDKFLDVRYDAETVEEGKAIAKETLQAELGLPVDATVPLFGYIGRLEEQKGVDILMAALPQVLQHGRVQVAILGTGKKALEREVMQLEEQFPGAAKGIVQFSTPLAHQIIAGSDFMLIPSRFEPCGLIQLHAMQYGSVPLVSSTGGLVDTVKDGETGFHMGEMDPDRLQHRDAQAVAQTMLKAAAAFSTPQFSLMRRKAIAQDLSWSKPARRWEAVLEDLASGTRQASARAATVRTPVQTSEHVARQEKQQALRDEARAAIRTPREPENVDTSAPVKPASAAPPRAASRPAGGAAAGGRAAQAPASPRTQTSSGAAPATSAAAAAGKLPAAAGPGGGSAARPAAAPRAAPPSRPAPRPAAEQPPYASNGNGKPGPAAAPERSAAAAAAPSSQGPSASSAGAARAVPSQRPASAASVGAEAQPASAPAGAGQAAKQAPGAGATPPGNGATKAGNASPSSAAKST